LIQVKAGSRGVVMIAEVAKQEPHMQIETAIIVAAIVSVFAVFGVVLAWAERQTQKPR
jgi:hypothetical protein